jgi:hypothetical protein
MESSQNAKVEPDAKFKEIYSLLLKKFLDEIQGNINTGAAIY